MKYFLETYGCQMNKAESSALESVLKDHSWVLGTKENADLVIINTCTVRATAENRAWGRIAQYAAQKRDRSFSLMIVGCMAEQYKSEMKKKQPGIDFVLGTFQKQSFGLILDQLMAGTSFDIEEEKPFYVFSKTHHESGAFRAFVPIMHGCDNFCSYCIVPYVRGREVSRSPMDILDELDRLSAAGVREVTLLGQNVNSYRWHDESGDLDFPNLLRMIAKHLVKTRTAVSEGIGWLRFLTSHPKDLSDDLIAAIAEEPMICKHVHLCVQSGSDRVLSAMNRKYSREYFLALVERMKAAIPELSLSTDILVGFPGESDEDVEETLDIMKKVGFSYSFMYHFNPREGTKAAKLPNRVPERLKKERLAKVIELQKVLTHETLTARLGSEDTVLIESGSRKSSRELLGRTSRDEMVVFSGDSSRIGSFARVRLLRLSGNTFRAEEVHG
jgi:tRNA-2-methylthio-N6-dimethylallyladenosine synthase